MQFDWFDWFLSVLEQKWLKNHEIYYIGAAELPLEFTYGVPLPKGDRDTSMLDLHMAEAFSLQGRNRKKNLVATSQNAQMEPYLRKIS